MHKSWFLSTIIGLFSLCLINSCKPPVVGASCDCADGFECLNGLCKKPCETPRDCSPAGKASCGSDGYCIEQCYQDDECDNNQKCLYNFCFAECDGSSDCEGDESCQAGFCTLVKDATCHYPSDCTATNGLSARCFEGRCQTTCNTMLDCQPSQDCLEGICQEIKNGECADDNDCTNGKCLGAICRTPCNSSLECASNQKCQEGYCMPAPTDGCQNDGVCQNLGAKYHCLEGSCHQECITFLDCEPYELCQLGFCFTNEHAECGNDKVCTGDQKCHGGRCLSPCDNNDMCKTAGQQCLFNYCQEPVCNNSFDCQKFERCEQGLCIMATPQNCLNDTQCTNGSSCYEGQCAKQCQNSRQCQGNQKCTFATTSDNVGICLNIDNPQCDNDTSCSEGVCYEGQCRPACNSSLDCQVTQKCLSFEHNSFCVDISQPLCFGQEGECPLGENCYEGACHKTCTSFAQCARNEDCVHSFCIPVENPECSSNNECTNNKAGYSCYQGQCKKPCTLSSECAATEICSYEVGTGLCLSPNGCTIDTDCGNNSVCRDSRCYYICNSAEDCPVSQIYDQRCMDAHCTNNLCIYDEPKIDGSPCDDKLICTVNDNCQQNICRGTAITGKCVIDGVCYEDGETKPDDLCLVCSASNPYEWSQLGDALSRCMLNNGVWELVSCQKGSSSVEICPLGCRADPAPHCIQPSNWGYWDGTNAHQDGLTLNWIRQASKNLSCTSSTLTIDTDNMTIKCGADLLDLNADDAKIINQDQFYNKSTINGLSDYNGTLSEIAAFRFLYLSVSSQTAVTCIGKRPLAIATVNEAKLSGTWMINCGGMTVDSNVAGIGQKAIDQDVTRYEISGGAGGGYSGNGGQAGLPVYARKGGKPYGNKNIQPLLGGAPGGNGLGIKKLEFGKAASSLEELLSYEDACIFSGNEFVKSSCLANTSSHTGRYNIAEWIANVWNKTESTVPETAAPSPKGGQGGGAMQLVSLSNITISSFAKIYAFGQGGQSLTDCASRTPEHCDFNKAPNEEGGCTFDGNMIMDYIKYPVLSYYCESQSISGCSFPKSTFPANGKPLFAWVLQSGGGGGSGGALLFEAPRVDFNNNSVLSVEGGGGGAACYMQGKSWQANYKNNTVCATCGGNTINHYSCVSEPTKQAGLLTTCKSGTDTSEQCYGPNGANSIYFDDDQHLTNFIGSSGATNSIDGQPANYGNIYQGADKETDCINNGTATAYDAKKPNVYYATNDEVNFNVNEAYDKFVGGDHDVSWGGAGGGAGRIRINTPGGNKVTCQLCSLSERFKPAAASEAIVIDQDFPETN